MTTVDAILRRRDMKTVFKLMKIDIQGGTTKRIQSHYSVRGDGSSGSFNHELQYRRGFVSKPVRHFGFLWLRSVRHVRHESSEGRLLHSNRSPVRAKDISSMVEGTHWRRPSLIIVVVVFLE